MVELPTGDQYKYSAVKITTVIVMIKPSIAIL
jgi:hypothetical protein